MFGVDAVKETDPGSQGVTQGSEWCVVGLMWSGWTGLLVEGRADIKSLEMPKIAPHPPRFSSLLSFLLPFFFTLFLQVSFHQTLFHPLVPFPSFFLPSFLVLSALHLPPHPLFIHSLPKSFSSSLADLLSFSPPSVIPSLLTSFHPNFFPFLSPLSHSFPSLSLSLSLFS